MKELDQIIRNHYNDENEEGRLLSAHGQVEYRTTMRYIEKYLRPGMRVLEVGAGTGRYSLALAKQGYKVDAVELVPHNIDIMRQNVTQQCDITIREGNALDLSFLTDDTFDITLVLGPLYHLFTPEDKARAIAEAIRVTRPRGTLFFAYCMCDATIIEWGFHQGNILSAIEKGMVDPETFRCVSDPALVFEISRREDIDAMMARFPVQRLHYVGTDMLANHMRAVVDAMDDDTFAAFLRYHFTICQRPDLVGITHHSLDICKKL